MLDGDGYVRLGGVGGAFVVRARGTRERVSLDTALFVI